MKTHKDYYSNNDENINKSIKKDNPKKIIFKKYFNHEKIKTKNLTNNEIIEKIEINSSPTKICCGSKINENCLIF